MAASPDGLVTDESEDQKKGLVEYKSISTARNLSLRDAYDQRKGGFPLLKNKDGSFFINMKHDHYVQCQMMMKVADRPWLDYVLSTEVGPPFIQRVTRDQEWWQDKLPKLTFFNFEALLPELAHKRYNCGGIREPPADKRL